MEWKIGEIKQVNGEWYQCVEGNGCENCAFKGRKCYLEGGTDDPIGECCYDRRRDNKDVIFKKLEKVGEPYILENKKFQKYRVFHTPYIYNKIDRSWQRFADPYYISLEIKQTKEDMEEKNDVKQTPLEKLVIDFFNNRVSDIEFEKRVSELYAKHSNSENIGKNMREFNLEAAKAGKPVCTRDGRKARIICTDTKGDPCPIIALVEENNIESAYHYDKNGQNAYNKSKLDLMMLPEKKEGWVNIVRGSDGKSHMGRGIFQSKEEAENTIKAFNDNLIDTIKVSWEE